MTKATICCYYGNDTVDQAHIRKTVALIFVSLEGEVPNTMSFVFFILKNFFSPYKEQFENHEQSSG